MRADDYDDEPYYDDDGYLIDPETGEILEVPEGDGDEDLWDDGDFWDAIADLNDAYA